MSLKIEDITPYDIYSSLVVRNSVPAKHVWDLSELLINVMVDDEFPDRLCVSQPPRTAKSSLITLAFPFWLVLMNPYLNILIVNYNKELATDFGLRLRQLFIDNKDLLASRNIYLSDKEYAKASFRFENKAGNLLGSIKLVGVGGTITGRDVDVLIADDLIKGVSDVTPGQLDKLWSYFTEILLQRLEPHSKLLMLGTRWSSDDPIGRLMEAGDEKYHFVNLKALRDDGSCIWSNRYTPQFFLEKKDDVGERMFEALYQGRPLDETGDFFDISKLNFVDTFKFNSPLIDMHVRSWDFAYSAEDPSKDNDYTASCKMYKMIDDTYYVTDITNERYGDRLFDVVKSTVRMDTANCIQLMETGTKGGASQELFNVYKKDLGAYRVLQSEPIGSKADRAFALKNAILDGKIYFYLTDNQRETMLRQLKGFPMAKHDDIIDALAYAYNYLSKDSGSVIGSAGRGQRYRI